MKKLFKHITVLLIAVIFVCSVTAQAYASGTKGIENAKNGVVSIQFYLKDAAFYLMSEDGAKYVQDFGTNGEGQWSSGSGFFVGKSGENPSYIVTNHHVVADYIKANEGETYVINTGIYYQEAYPVYLIAESCEMRVYYDDNNYDVAYIDCYGDMEKVDLAVLKLRDATDKRSPLQIMVPTKDMVGDTVYALGFPGNADNDFTSASHYGIDDMTVTKGSITKFAANDKGVERIQTDAAIHHGNSGGPMATESGVVVGVNTNVMSTSPYSSQIEVDYYAINASELVTFLDKNNIPYEMANQGGFPVAIVVAVVGVVVVAAAAFLVLFKKKAAAPAGNGVPGAVNVPSRRPTSRRAYIRSMAAQHNGMALALSDSPILIGRDPGNCKLVYTEGTAGVSGQHCSISFDAATGEFILTDLRSTYGTFLINGQKLDANVPCRIKPGNGFYVGDRANEIRVELE